MEEKEKKVDHPGEENAVPTDKASVLVPERLPLAHSPVSDLEGLFLHQSLQQTAKRPAFPALKDYYFTPASVLCKSL